MKVAVSVWLGWAMIALVQSQATSSIAVDLGVQRTAPGQRALVPVVLSGSGDHAAVTELSLEVAFPIGQASFVGAEKGQVPTSGGVKIETELGTSDSNAKESLLKVHVLASTPMSEGELVVLAFDIPAEAEIGSAIQLRILKRTIKAEGGSVSEARGMDGVIAVTVPGDVMGACFFYMH